MGRPLVIALLQMTSGRDLRANLVRIRAAISEAGERGAGLLATPEMSLLLDRNRDAVLANALDPDDDCDLAELSAAACAAGIWLLIGSAPVRVGADSLVNRSLLISPEGRLVAHYDKIHLFDVDLPGGESWRESRSYVAGTRAVVADIKSARLGLSICYDLRFPALYRALAKAGAEILTVPAAFTRPTGQAHWQVLLQARAIETGCFVIATAQSGQHEDGRATHGHSLIVNPWGEILLDAGEEPGLYCCKIDLDEVAAARGRIPSLRHDRPFAIEGEDGEDRMVVQ